MRTLPSSPRFSDFPVRRLAFHVGAIMPRTTFYPGQPALRRGQAQSRDLAHRCDVFARSIVIPRRWSRYEVLSADAPTKRG